MPACRDPILCWLLLEVRSICILTIASEHGAPRAPIAGVLDG